MSDTPEKSVWTRRFSNKWVICPWCSHEHGDAWEWANKETETKCDACDNAFSVLPEYSVEYITFVTGRERS